MQHRNIQDAYDIVMFKHLIANLGKKSLYKILKAMIAKGFKDTETIRSLFTFVNSPTLEKEAAGKDQIVHAAQYIQIKYKTKSPLDFPQLLAKSNSLPFTREECNKLLLKIDKKAKLIPEIKPIEIKPIEIKPAAASPAVAGKFFKKDAKKFKDFKTMDIGKVDVQQATHQLETARKTPKVQIPQKQKEQIKTSQRNDKVWIIKKLNTGENETHLFNECLAQELIRMLLDPFPARVPLQPKTRLLQMKDGSTCLISEVVSFSPIREVEVSAFRENVKNGTFTGIGRVSAISYIVADGDRHGFNIGYNNEGKLVTIDGGHSFKQGKEYEIKAEVIQALPFIKKDSPYKPYNYFELLRYNKESKKSDRDEKTNLVTEDMSTQANIRHEINQTFLKFVVIPDTLITEFVSAYTDNKQYIEFYNNYLIKRKNEAISEALQVPDFRKYILNSQSRNELAKYVDELAHFKTMEKNYILGHPTDSKKTKSIFAEYDKIVEYAQQIEKVAKKQPVEKSVEETSVQPKDKDEKSALVEGMISAETKIPVEAKILESDPEKHLLQEAINANDPQAAIEIIKSSRKSIDDLFSNFEPINKSIILAGLLGTAARERNIEIFNRLLEAKPDLEVKNEEGQSLLFFLAEDSEEMEQTDLAIIKALIKAKANLEAQWNGYTPLWMATKNGHHEMVKVLLDEKANFKGQLKDGTSLLHRAVTQKNEILVQHLLDANANPNVSRLDGYTPLYTAVYYGQNKIIKILVDKKADPNTAVDGKKTPLYTAAKNRNEQGIKYLLEAKADINAKNKQGLTPLCYAILHESIAAVNSLLQAKADPTIKTNDGLTPLTLVKKIKHVQIACALEQAIEHALQEGKGKDKALQEATEKDPQKIRGFR